MKIKKILISIGVLGLVFFAGYAVRSALVKPDTVLINQLEEKVVATQQLVDEKEAENHRLVLKNAQLEMQVNNLQESADTSEAYSSDLTAELGQLKKIEKTIKDKDLLITNLRLQIQTQEERHWSDVSEIQDLKAIIKLKDEVLVNLNTMYINRGIALKEALDSMYAGLATSKKLAKENKTLRTIVKIGGGGVIGYVAWKGIVKPILVK